MIDRTTSKTLTGVAGVLYRYYQGLTAVIAIFLLTTTACAQTTKITKPAEASQQATSTAKTPTEPTTRIVVAKDGSGDYKYIQDAIDAVRAFTPVRITIYIRNGTYKEKVHIPAWVTDINLVGESPENTIITYDDHAGRGKMGTFDTYTLRIEGNNINVENLTIRNTAGPVGQAVALHVEGDRLVFRNCRFLGDQDTIFASGEGARQYYVDCYIEGTTDFIFGPATALFENCQIHSKKDSYITAASTPEWVRWGYVFKNCTFTAAPGVHEVYLGRPWRDYAKTVFINCTFGPHIRPEGWHNWSRPEAEKTSFYAEYNNRGPGAGTAKRVGWSHQLTAQQAAEYTAENIFSAHTDTKTGDNIWYRRQTP
ncbi:pectinesterase family protein [Cesiribacter sp. SM1]|uniref:pectinesterase family protein n=1 Tax=Cesiribacter sp. SM1 TaxID=2861196 RepID=UPI001CD40087|nr:pectinesterase family protein [Cesiribacter sp. SM1]